jgi:hypothetical protein
MENSIPTLISSAITGLIVALITWFLSRKLKKTNYNESEKKVTLESIRASLESQMYSINDRLIQNEERWKDVNHLLLRGEYLTNNTPLNNAQRTYYSQFLKANGIVENDLIIDSKLIFVLTPFHPKFDEDFLAIREACTALGYKCIRGDESNFKSDIFAEILKIIVASRLVIANVNGRNSNVMYELGIAQALDKPVILVSSEPQNLPTDIKSKRFFIYANYKELQEMLRSELSNF